MMYLDHAATTPLHPEVIGEMTSVMESVYGNPSSIHHYGRTAHHKLEEARQMIADSLGVKPHEIIFNSGGTESDNTAILQSALARQAMGKHIITTAIEHPAVLETMKYLVSIGFEVTYLPVDAKGQLAVETFKEALREDTILVSIMYANNETGNLLPIAEIGALLREHPALFHTDAVQAYGKLPLAPDELGVDLLSVTAHKINGPKGIGFLYKKDGIQLASLLHGGEQEEKRRPGTENLVGICGMAKAISLLTPAVQTQRAQEYQAFSERIQNILATQQIDYQLNGDPDHKLPHILNLHFAGVSNALVLMKLDLKGIAISTGSACTAGNVEPSHVLEAMYGKENPIIRESIRISFGYGNTLSEISAFAHLLSDIVAQTKK